MGLWAHGPHGPMGPWAPWAHGPMPPPTLLLPKGWPHWYDTIKHNIILYYSIFFECAQDQTIVPQVSGFIIQRRHPQPSRVGVDALPDLATRMTFFFAATM